MPDPPGINLSRYGYSYREVYRYPNAGDEDGMSDERYRTPGNTIHVKSVRGNDSNNNNYTRKCSPVNQVGSDAMTASETETTVETWDQPPLFYIECKNRQNQEEFDDVSGIFGVEDPIAYEARRQRELELIKQQQQHRHDRQKHIENAETDEHDDYQEKMYRSSNKSLDSTEGNDDIRFKARPDDVEEDDDEKSLMSASRWSVFGTKTQSRRFLTDVQAVPDVGDSCNDKTKDDNSNLVNTQAVPVVADKNSDKTSDGNSNFLSTPLSPPSRHNNNGSRNADSTIDKKNLLQILNSSLGLTPSQLSTLREEGCPLGLAQQLGKTKQQFPIRFWIVDNSGSMRTLTEMVESSLDAEETTSKTSIPSCSRWEELQEAVMDHAELAGLLRIPTSFVLLNEPDGAVGHCQQYYKIAQKAQDNNTGFRDVLELLNAMEQTKPEGGTPLTLRLSEIRYQIEQIQSILRPIGRSAIIVVATDGLPTDDEGAVTQESKQQFVDTLRSFQSLPVRLVIRLCTDDEDVVNYYSSIEKEPGMKLEVVAKFLSESNRIYNANKWLNYAVPLHRCREMGFHHKMFGILRERRLDKDELIEFLQLLFGSDTFKSVLDIHRDWKKFKSILSAIVMSEGKHWCATTRKKEYWIDLNRLEKIYGKSRMFPLSWEKMKPSSASKTAGRRHNPSLGMRNTHFQTIDERTDVLKIKERQLQNVVEVCTPQNENITSKLPEPPEPQLPSIAAGGQPSQSSLQNSGSSIDSKPNGSRTSKGSNLDPPARSSWELKKVTPVRRSKEKLEFYNDSVAYPESVNEFSDASSYVEETVYEENTVYEEQTVYDEHDVIEGHTCIEQTIYEEEEFVEDHSIPNTTKNKENESYEEQTVYEEESVYEEQTVYDEQTVYEEQTVLNDEAINEKRLINEDETVCNTVATPFQFKLARKQVEPALQTSYDSVVRELKQYYCT